MWWSRRAWVAAAPALLAGCGFELRRPPAMPFRRLALVDFKPRSPIAEELRRQLAGQVELVSTPAQAEVLLQSLYEARERVAVTSTAAGQVRELQVRVRFRFRIATAGGRELAPVAELLHTRDMQYNETQALAKEQEEAMIARALEADIAAQVARRLSRVVL